MGVKHLHLLEIGASISCEGDGGNLFTCIPIVVSRNGGKIEIGSTARKVNPLNETALRNGECELCTVVDAQCQCSIDVFENARWCTIVVITE